MRREDVNERARLYWSASHNAYEDNGIKLFGPDGHKLSDDIEMEIERLLDSDLA